MGENIIKVTPIRKIIGEKLRSSILTHPQCTQYSLVDMTALSEIKDELAAQGKKVTYTALAVRAMIIALKDFPMMNSRIVNGEIIVYDHVNPGMAIDRGKGLHVLVMKNSDKKDVSEISNDAKELIQKMEAGKITMDDMSGGTVTISSPGNVRMDMFDSIINNDECLILGVGSMKNRVLAKDNGEIYVAKTSWIAVNYNHSIVDGMYASNFVTKISDIMENPKNYSFI